MTKNVAISLLVLSLFSIVALAAEFKQKDMIEGTWSLTKKVNGKEIYNRSGNLPPTPRDVGFVFLDEGEFKVPGEDSGSKRFTIPKGLHFRIEPSFIAENGVTADVLLSYTDIKNESVTGFTAEKCQLDGRYDITFDKRHVTTLSIPNIQSEYTLTFLLQRAD